jgi:F-type H+-transporting ATPase subunit a
MILTSSFLDIIKNYFLDLPMEIIVSLVIMVVIAIFSIVIGNKMKKADPLAKQTTGVFIGEFIVGGVVNYAEGLMGKRYKNYYHYFVLVAMYLPLAFLSGLLNLPSPITYFAVPLTFGIITFGLIHGTSIKYTKWRYFERFVSPTWLLLPINILTTPMTIVSLSARLFGNALSGTIIMSLIYWATGVAAEALTGSVFNFFGPIIAPVFHAYFDFFGAFVQTLVFLSLTCLFIAAEGPEEN